MIRYDPVHQISFSEKNLQILPLIGWNHNSIEVSYG